MTDAPTSLAAEFAAPERAAWLALVQKVLKGADYDKRLVSRTDDGIPVGPLYSRADQVAGAGPLGRQPGAGDGLGWEIRQLTAMRDAGAANAAILEDLEGGAGGVNVQFEAPGQIGLAATEAELAAALEGVHLNMIPLTLAAGGAWESAATALAAVYQRRGTAPGDRRAALAIDPIGALARTGGAAEAIEAQMARAAGLATSAAWSQTPARIFLADGRFAHEAGGSEAQELAVMLASAVAALRALERVGVAPQDGLARIGFALAADADMFLTIAKLRAARRLIGQVADAAGAQRALADVALHVSTSERMMARRDPWVNMLRTTSAAIAAGIGGADSISVLPFTWALGQPDAFARRIARNVQVIAQEESGLGRVADPAAGTWSIEQLTERMAEQAWVAFQQIEAEGGLAAAVLSGALKTRIDAVASARAKTIATGRAALTGVSAYPRLGEDGVTVEPWQVAPSVVAPVVRAPVLAAIRLGAPFEDLRDRADQLAKTKGQVPRLFLAALGALADHTVRSTYIRNYLAAGGIDVIAGDGFTNSADVGAAFAQSGARIACICSSDAVYAELAEATAGVLKQAGAAHVYLAGRPKDEAVLKAAGVDQFIAAGSDQLATLARLLDQLA